MDINKILKEEEDSFYKRYCLQEIVSYKNITLLGSLKALFKRHILFQNNNESKNDDDDDDDVYLLENFWDHFLRDNTSVISLIHAINIILLIITTYYVVLLPYYNYSLLFDCLVWILISFLCLLSISVYKMSILQLKAKELWTKVGYLILYIRGLHTMTKIVKTIMAIAENRNVAHAFDAYEGILNTKGNNEAYFIKIVLGAFAIDLTQLVVFSTVPFPSPINFYFCINELILQIVRLNLNPHSSSYFDLDQYIFYGKLVIIIFSHFMVLLSVVGVEFMAKQRFKNLALAQLATADKNRFINLICSDTKAIVSDLTIAIKSIADQCSDTDMSIHVNNLLKHAERINVVADNLSVLIKLGDEQVSTVESIESAVNIKFLVEKVRMDPCFMNFNVELKIDFTSNVDQCVLIDADKLYMLLRNCMYCCFDKVMLLHDFDVVAIKLSCKLENTKDNNTRMLVFTISNTDQIKNYYMRQHNLKSKIKAKKTFSRTFEIAESKIVALMGLSSCLDGYCEVTDEVSGVSIEFGVSCKIVSPMIEEDAQQPLVTGVSDNDIDQTSLTTRRMIKSSRINSINVSVVTKDYVKFQMMIKFLRHVGIKSEKITNLKSLDKLYTSSRHAFGSPVEINESHLTADLLLIDSVEEYCKLVKYGKYSGLVVLVNDETIDSKIYKDFEKSAYHYQVPLHYIHIDIMKFDEWLGDQLCRPRTKQAGSVYNVLPTRKVSNKISKVKASQVKSNQTFSASSSSFGDEGCKNSLSFESSNKKLGLTYFRKFFSHRKFDYTPSVWGHWTLSFKHSAVEDTYVRTRVLNPTKCWIHPGSAVVWSAYSYFAGLLLIHTMSLFFIKSGAFRLKHFVLVIAIVLIWCKDYVFYWTNLIFGLSCITYCMIWFFVILFCWGVTPLVTLFIVIRDGKVIFSNPFEEPHRDIDSFLHYHYNGYNGRECIDSIFVNVLFLIGTYGFGFLFWPFSLIFPCMNFVVLLLFTKFVSRFVDNNDPEFQSVVAVIVTTFYTLVTVSLSHFEWMNRTNFQLFRRATYTNDFIAECYMLCHHDVVNPLKEITTYHKELFSLLLEDILNKRLTLNLSIKRSVHSMNIQFLLLELLLFDTHKGLLDSNNLPSPLKKVVPTESDSSYKMEHKDSGFVNELHEPMDLTSEIKDINENVYIKSEIQQLSEALSAHYNQDNFYVKIYVKVDETLSIIRANKKLIRILIAVAILNSVEIMQQNNYQNKSSAESFNEIVITVKPRSVNRNLPFPSRRWMNVAVRSTGPAVDSNNEKSSNFVQYKCNEIMDLIAKMYTSESLLESSTDHKYRNNIFNLELPYKLHSCHEQLLSICNKKVNTRLKLVDNNILLGKYEQWRQSKKNNTEARAYSVLIIQHIPNSDNTLVEKLLQGAGWTVELVSSIRVVEFNAGYLNCDCVIIDYSRCDNSKKLSQGKQLDEIEIIKLLGYRGLLVGLFDNYTSLSKGLQKHYKKQFHLVISHPVIDKVIDTVATAMIAHELRLLLYFSST